MIEFNEKLERNLVQTQDRVNQLENTKTTTSSGSAGRTGVGSAVNAIVKPNAIKKQVNSMIYR